MSEHARLERSGDREGLRERKRRETRRRIAESGLRLFLTHGYDGTTLDAIASAAGISRRGFFSYFKSKDDIVLFWLEDSWVGIYADLLKTSPDLRPLEAVRDILVAKVERYTGEEMDSLDALMRSSPTLQARKQAFYVEREQALFETLCEVWRQPERRMALRMIAMVAIGASRLATQTWQAQAAPRTPIAQHLHEAFDALAREL
ncbi:MAG TPA: helix-turn-helix domain-containing protein [Dokdonella sp.]|uniref:TetR/AcrR family transcriptional regulator n=1 Tax=Dokdonella sp. TaxID=2291710 RepID=UPI002CE89CA2|nr:helix-turn-helix domain-containing protein [Dokdonella sp.]HUD43455.1 helix-turn-helix domain-containing protein [Dokdonella sp.]